MKKGKESSQKAYIFSPWTQTTEICCGEGQGRRSGDWVEVGKGEENGGHL